MDEGGAADVVPRLAFLRQHLLDDILRRDTRVVGAGQPERSSPHIRRHLTMTSCTVLLRPWPMCSTAVTFGGGMTMTYGGREPPFRANSDAVAR
jgi:hypothetical protein